jgi:DNA topoisomerase VI subunit B
MSRELRRELFETTRQLEYFSEKELSMQLGAAPARWGVVLIKELVDNALDACETAGTPPEISVTLTADGFTVVDNGPGMPTALIERSLDYDVRVSDKTHYISPSRGQLGNALKCLWAAPYAIDPDQPGHVEVVSRSVQHRIRVMVDRIAQLPRLAHHEAEAPICRNGTVITISAPKLAHASTPGRKSTISTNQHKTSLKPTLRSIRTPRSGSTSQRSPSTTRRPHRRGRNGSPRTRPHPCGMSRITSWR